MTINKPTLSLPGIYAIYRVGTNDCYVGQSVNIRKRWTTHKQDFKNNRHASRYMQRVYNKNGVNVFEYRVLEQCDVYVLTDRETFWVEKLNPKYNSCPVAGSCLGYKHSEETRAKHRTNMIGNKHALGKPGPNKGKQFSAETCARLSAANMGHPGPNKGIPRTDDVKLKISLKKTGVPWSDARRNVHRPMSVEDRTKLSIKMKGRVSPNKGKSRSLESNLKQSISMKGKVPWNKGIRLTKSENSLSPI